MKILDIKYLQECIVFQILLANKLCNFISLYRSPSQPTDIFDQFADNLKLTLNEVANHNPFLIVVLGDFNIKSENNYKHDKTSYEGAKIDALTSQFELQQFGLQQFGPQQFGSQQFGLQQFGSQQFGSQQFGLQQFGLQQFGLQQFGLQQIGSQQFGSQQFRLQQFIKEPAHTLAESSPCIDLMFTPH